MGAIHHAPPVIKKKPIIATLESEEDEEEIQQREMMKKRKIDKWKYSLFNKNNFVTLQESKAEMDVKVQNTPAKGVMTSISPTKKKTELNATEHASMTPNRQSYDKKNMK